MHTNPPHNAQQLPPKVNQPPPNAYQHPHKEYKIKNYYKKTPKNLKILIKK